jgi:long-subunit acyl-CoA synthetase (AMP-forming)
MTVVTAKSLESRVARLAAALERVRPRALGLLADNGPDWLGADLAAERAGVPLVPLPAFFTPAQLAHAVAASGMDALLCDAPALAGALGFGTPAAIDGSALGWYRRVSAPVDLPAGTAKVTFTSGTTGAPKPVYLSAIAQNTLAHALDEATRPLALKRHLCLLPLAVLLENVAGARTALAARAECVVPPLAEAGVRGATGFDPLACLAALARCNAESVILLPQMMHALAAALEAGAPVPPRLAFAAVGGAKVAPSLLLRARAAGLPAYEGYGLTECASVVALNLPGADRPGSVGRPLPHLQVRIGDGGEIVAAGVRTGDLGRLDDEGFLYVEGRRKHVIITSFGRNVSPEWPEAELAAGGAIAQCAVFGEARPQLGAVLVPRAPATPEAALQAEVERANARLPDYARIGAWMRADAPFSPADGTLTANGRVRRDAVWARYGARLEAQFSIRPGVPAHAVL